MTSAVAPTRPHTTRRRIPSVRNDDGSLLLVILFTIMMSALVLVATATMIVGLHKSADSRDYAIALQAADAAFADAVMNANVDPSKFLNDPDGVVRSDPDPTTGEAWHKLGSGAVQWQWTATRVGSTTKWDLNVEAVGTVDPINHTKITMDRHFTSTLKATLVHDAYQNPQDGTLRYIVEGGEYHTYGFFGANEFTVLDGTLAIDGYNGEYGTVGSNKIVTLGPNTKVARLDLWNWTTADAVATRCVGANCAAARLTSVPYPATFTDREIDQHCPAASVLPAWKTSDGPLTPGACYASLTFESDTNFNQALAQSVYVTGNVTVQARATANTALGTSLNAPAGNLRIKAKGNYTQAANSKVALAFYSQAGACTLTGTANDVQYRTYLLGSLTCGSVKTSGNIRLRYDGGLGLYLDGGNSGLYVFDVYDYESID